MIECMVAAPHSGSGKTVVTCALLAALKRRRHDPCAFKCGPDYIDPMFHRAVLGVESHNLDLYLSSEATVRSLYVDACAGHGAAVCEGVMGFYDGVGGTTERASAWHLADTLGIPVLLTLRPKGASLSLAAVVRGLQTFAPNSYIAAILLNDCSPSLYSTLAPMLEEKTGLPVLGYLPPMPEAKFESRHLGLYTAGEIIDLRSRINALAATILQTVDWPRFEQIFETPDHGAARRPYPQAMTRIAVARDQAFCFTYAETIETFCRAGAEPVFFSPLHDQQLPSDIGGLYLPGGYPELHAEALSHNESMRTAIRAAIDDGMPTVAECGGFLYLGQSLQDGEGQTFPMVGVLPGHGLRTEKLVRFGYAELTARQGGLLLRQGESTPVHEFHYWDSTENGDAFEAVKPVSGRKWTCGFTTPTLYAAFSHLYFAGNMQMARRFVAAARNYHAKEE